VFVKLSIVLVIPNVFNVVNKLVVCVLSLKLVDVCDDGFMRKPTLRLWVIHKTLID